MKVQIYKSTSPLRPTLRGVFRSDTNWGTERGGHRHEHWTLETETDLSAASGTIGFSADEAKTALQREGVFIYQVAASELHQQEHAALNAYRMRFTLPFFQDHGDEAAPEILGSGTLFEHEGRCFVVTADHIFRQRVDDASSPLIPMEDVALPDAPRASGKEPPAKMVTLGRHTIYRLKPPVAADVVVLELHDETVIAQLRASWGFLPLSAVDDLSENDERFVITGFLAQGVRYERGVVSQSMLNLETDRFHLTPVVKDPADGLDLFLYLQAEAITVDGKVRHIQSLRGLSGGPIWSLRAAPGDAFWDPSRAMKVVAVQSSEMRQQWARATDWKAVKAILANPEVGFSASPFS